LATGALFFALALIYLIGQQLIAEVTKVSGPLHPPSLSGLLLAICFLITSSVVQLAGSRLMAHQSGTSLTRRERFNGAGLGLLNGLLLVANAMRFAAPFLRAVEDTRIGGWSAQLLLPHLGHPDPSTFSVSMLPTTLIITPSPLLAFYNAVPIPLVFLVAFLVFIFVGSVYGRALRAHE
jgi:hypothetical protein